MKQIRTRIQYQIIISFETFGTLVQCDQTYERQCTYINAYVNVISMHRKLHTLDGGCVSTAMHLVVIVYYVVLKITLGDCLGLSPL